jgi:hypothetical protein
VEEVNGATGRQKSKKVRATVATACIDRSPGGSTARKELSFRKKFPIPISSLSQVLHLFSFIYVSLSVSPSLFSHRI